MASALTEAPPPDHEPTLAPNDVTSMMAEWQGFYLAYFGFIFVLREEAET